MKFDWDSYHNLNTGELREMELICSSGYCRESGKVEANRMPDDSKLSHRFMVNHLSPAFW